MIELTFALVASATAAPPAADLALATAIEGEVSYRSAEADGEGELKLVPFAKVRTGDVLVLPKSASIELMFFADGHIERFAGPLELEVGSDVEPVERADGDALVGEALRRLPGLVKRAELDKGGHTLMRGNEAEAVPLGDFEREEIEEARKHYATLRESAEAADVLPEVYLSTVYLSLGQNDDAVAVLKSAQERCAKCTGPKRLLAALE